MHARAVLYLLLAALGFSTGGAAIKATTLTAWQVTSGRSAIAALFLVLVLPGARKRWTGKSVLVGLAFAGVMTCFVLANKLTTSASAIFLQSTAPLYLLVLQPLLLREPVRRLDVIFAPFFGAGLALFFLSTDPVSQTAPNPLAGNLVAALSGVFWALTLIGLRYLSRGAVHPGSDERRGVEEREEGESKRGEATKDAEEGNSLPGVVAGNVFAALFALPFALRGGMPEGNLATVAVLPLLYLGVVQIGLSYVCMNKGIHHATALEAGLILLLEPTLNPVWSAVVHGERLSGFSLVGGGVILVATALRVLWGARVGSRAA